MNNDMIKRESLAYIGWYTIFAAGITASIIYFAASVIGIAIPAVALAMGGGTIGILVFLFWPSDTGLETVSAGAEIGFRGGNPQQYQSKSMPGPGVLALVFYLVGLLVISIVTVVVYL